MCFMLMSYQSLSFKTFFHIEVFTGLSMTQIKSLLQKYEKKNVFGAHTY